MSATRSVDSIIEQLQERAKELHALYQVHELTSLPSTPIEEICRLIAEVLPGGWQFPSVCWAKITLEDVSYQPPGTTDTPWGMRADVVLQGEKVGSVEVFYTRQMPRADEGPFLKEERKLLNTVAERLAHFLMQRRLQSSLDNWQSAMESLASPDKREWLVIIDFLRKTDQQLLMRISRRMLNYLCWNGVQDAIELLGRFAADFAEHDAGSEDNRPLRRKSMDELLQLTDEAFQIAADTLSEGEIVSCIQKWIRDDKSGFLVEAVENQCTSLADIGQALDRYHQLSVHDEELSPALQVGLRVNLARRFFTEDLEFINTAKRYIEVGDFYDLVHRVISTTSSHGKLGGKSSGMLLASQILRKSPEYRDLLGDIRVPKTWYIASDGLMSFVEYNQMEDVYNRKYLEIEQIRREYPHIVQVFKNSKFAPEIVRGLSLALDDLDGRPLIVRSSSLLEDRMGAAFSGKYKSLFLANVGTKNERLTALMDAIAEVYASLFGADPIEYRAERNLLDLHEEMGIMIQEVVGTRVGPYFMPSYAGVAFSNNEFRWSPRIRRDDGLVRLVPGLGTRAVDRVGDDYPVLVAPGQPGLRVNVTADEVIRYAPRQIDVINMEERRFETLDIADLLREYGAEYPALEHVASVLDHDGLHRPIGFGFDPRESKVVVTFEGLVASTNFMARMRALLSLLREKMGVPVDVEFASDGRDFYLLQCRPQSYSLDAVPSAIPRDLPRDRVLFSADRYVSNGRVPEITHIVYVDPDEYENLQSLADLKDVGRAVGRLNKLLPKRQFILMGPGRWGSRGDIKLGVPVTYSDINNTAVLMEIAAKRGNYVPDLSFGTHFFQDLVEAGIRYLPLFPGDGAGVFNELFLRRAPNILADVAPEYAHLADVVRVIDVSAATEGLVLHVLMNADLDEAVGYLTTPTHAAVAGAPPERRSEPPALTEDHWRWRLRMAEHLASQLDPARFGVKALYVFGSTKNATAGGGSDIDLIAHVDSDPE
ncbi:MAG: phosphoenolpyruvate synthase, partial [Acidobacteria bacterium]|nr:phosphoenolpyruvate synthase [Acidobacteriota bacterium]